MHFGGGQPAGSFDGHGVQTRSAEPARLLAKREGSAYGLVNVQERSGAEASSASDLQCDEARAQTRCENPELWDQVQRLRHENAEQARDVAARLRGMESRLDDGLQELKSLCWALRCSATAHDEPRAALPPCALVPPCTPQTRQGGASPRPALPRPCGLRPRPWPRPRPLAIAEASEPMNRIAFSPSTHRGSESIIVEPPGGLGGPGVASLAPLPPLFPPPLGAARSIETRSEEENGLTLPLRRGRAGSEHVLLAQVSPRYLEETAMGPDDRRNSGAEFIGQATTFFGSQLGGDPVEDEKRGHLVAALAARLEEDWTRGNPELHGVWPHLCYLFVDVLHPRAAYAMRWAALNLLVMTFVCFLMPLLVGFNVSTHKNAASVLLNLIDVFFAMDMYQCFRTAIYVDGKEGKPLVWRRSAIAINYLTGWFLADLISTLPLAWMMNATGFYERLESNHAERLGRVMRMLKLIKLIRLSKPDKAFSRVQTWLGIPPNVARLARTIVTIVFMFHLTGCIFFYIADVSSEINEDVTTWIQDIGIEDYNLESRYLESIYWAVTTLTTTGFGDTIPITTIEKAFAMLVMLIGLTVFTYLLTSVARLMDMSNSALLQKAAVRQEVDSFLRGSKLPSTVEERVKAHCSFVVDHSQGQEQQRVLSMLSSNLKREVLLYMYSSLIETVPFFRNKGDDFICDLIQALKPELVTPGEFVLVQGLLGTEMYFVRSGKLEVRVTALEEDLAKLRNLASTCAYRARIADMGAVLGMEVLEASELADVVSPESAPGAARSSEHIKGTGMDHITWNKLARTVFHNVMNVIVPGHRRKQLRRRLVKEAQRLNVMAPGSFNVIREVTEGEFFGELGCIACEPRTASVVCVEWSELQTLSRAHLLDLFRRYPIYLDELGVTLSELEALDMKTTGRGQRRTSHEEGKSQGRILWDRARALVLPTMQNTRVKRALEAFGFGKVMNAARQARTMNSRRGSANAGVIRSKAKKSQRSSTVLQPGVSVATASSVGTVGSIGTNASRPTGGSRPGDRPRALTLPASQSASHCTPRNSAGEALHMIPAFPGSATDAARALAGLASPAQQHRPPGVPQPGQRPPSSTVTAHPLDFKQWPLAPSPHGTTTRPPFTLPRMLDPVAETQAPPALHHTWPVQRLSCNGFSVHTVPAELRAASPPQKKPSGLVLLDAFRGSDGRTESELAAQPRAHAAAGAGDARSGAPRPAPARGVPSLLNQPPPSAESRSQRADSFGVTLAGAPSAYSRRQQQPQLQAAQGAPWQRHSLRPLLAQPQQQLRQQGPLLPGASSPQVLHQQQQRPYGPPVQGLAALQTAAPARGASHQQQQQPIGAWYSNVYGNLGAASGRAPAQDAAYRQDEVANEVANALTAARRA